MQRIAAIFAEYQGILMRIALMVLLLCWLLPVHAEIYTWTDANGRIHYSDQKPEDATDVKTVESQPINRLPDNADSGNEPGILQRVIGWFGGNRHQGESAAPKVVMYATSWCGYCRKAREYFAANGIDYIEYDIEYDMEAKSRYDAFKGRGIPVIFVDGERMNGFDAGRFRRLYASRRLI